MTGWLDWLRGRRRVDPRVAEWHGAWNSAAEAPSPEAAGRLRAGLEALGGLRDGDETFDLEREMLEALDGLVALIGIVDRDGLPVVPTGHQAARDGLCHFSAAASLVEDAAQPAGTLLLTSSRAAFVGGARPLLVPWHLVAACTRQGRDLLLVRADRPDAWRVRCNTFGDALRAAFVARRLASRPRV